MELNQATQQQNQDPSQKKLDPNEMVTISNAKTGEIKQVQRSALPTYGLPLDYESPADTYAQGIMGNSGMNLTTVPDRYKAAVTSVLNTKGFVDPNTPVGKQQSADKQAAGGAKSLIQATLQNYENVPADQKGVLEGNKAEVPLAGGILAPQAKEYESGLQGEAPALGKVFGGQGSGLRITQAEINSWMPMFPSIHKTDAQNAADVQKLDTIMKGKFGSGLDDEYLQSFGLTRDPKGNAQLAGHPLTQSATPGQPNGTQPPTPGTPTPNESGGLQIANAVGNTIKDVGGKVIDSTLSTAKNDINDIVAGIVAQHGQAGLKSAADTATQLETEAAQTKDLNQKKVLLRQANDLRGAISQQAGQEGANFSPDVNANPLERAAVGATQIGGVADVAANPGAVIKGVAQPFLHPVQTAQAVGNVVKDPVGALTTFLKNDYANSFGGKLPGAAKVATPPAGMGVDQATAQPSPNGAPGTPPTKTQNTGRQIIDTLNSGGSPEYVARQAKNSWLPPQNQVLLQNGVYAHPTETGRIQATSKALSTIGANLSKAYGQATTPINGAEFENKATQALMENGVPKNDANQIVSRVMSDVKDTAGIDLSSLNANIPAKQFWKAAQFLEKYNPTIKGDADATQYLKQNSQTITRLMRETLGNAVPESQPLAGQYGALKDFQNNGYKFSNAATDGFHGAMRTVATPVRNGVNAVVNKNLFPNAPFAGNSPLKLANGDSAVSGASATPANESPVVQNATPPQSKNQPLQGAGTSQQSNNTIQFDKRAKTPTPRKGSQQLLAQNSPSYLKKLAH